MWSTSSPASLRLERTMIELMTPSGVGLHVGQKWKEVDPRFDRIVTIKGWEELRGETIILIQGKRLTRARLARFNGRRGGYVLVE